MGAISKRAGPPPSATVRQLATLVRWAVATATALAAALRRMIFSR